MSRIKSFMTFIFGAAAGSAATFIFVKKYYERISQEEIDSVKEVFSKKYEKTEAEKEYEQSYKDIEECDDIIDEHNYDIQSNDEEALERKYNSSESEDEYKYPEPYIISPDEFGSEDYEAITLTYYNDMILADEDNEPIEDVDGTVGFASLGTFGEYEDDAVYVRNDRLECDYEILRDYRKYSDVIKNEPPRIGS